MLKSEKSIWITILAIEVTFMILTRAVLSRYDSHTLNAELIRTALRLVAVLLYWRLLRNFINFKPTRSVDLRQPALLLGLALFLCVPLLVGDWSDMPPTTRLVYAITSFAVALKEEISFRALIQNLLTQRLGNSKAIILTTLLFTAYHVGAIPFMPFTYGQVVIAGLLLGIVYARTQNLWLVVWLHTLYDALWSLTPVLSPPLHYLAGLGLLVVSLLLVVKWGWPALRSDSGANVSPQR